MKIQKKVQLPQTRNPNNITTLNYRIATRSKNSESTDVALIIDTVEFSSVFYN